MSTIRGCRNDYKANTPGKTRTNVGPTPDKALAIATIAPDERVASNPSEESKSSQKEGRWRRRLGELARGLRV